MSSCTDFQTISFWDLLVYVLSLWGALWRSKQGSGILWEDVKTAIFRHMIGVSITAFIIPCFLLSQRLVLNIYHYWIIGQPQRKHHILFAKLWLQGLNIHLTSSLGWRTKIWNNHNRGQFTPLLLPSPDVHWWKHIDPFASHYSPQHSPLHLLFWPFWLCISSLFQLLSASLLPLFPSLLLTPSFFRMLLRLPISTLTLLLLCLFTCLTVLR